MSWDYANLCDWLLITVIQSSWWWWTWCWVIIFSTPFYPQLNAHDVRPICVAEHLAPFLPSHPAMPVRGEQTIEAVSAAPFGSASINLISWAYIKMLGGKGLVDSSKIALLNANYMASRLQGHYNLRYKNENGRVAHELLIDLAEFDKAAGLKVTDFAKRLQVRSTVPCPASTGTDII